MFRGEIDGMEDLLIHAQSFVGLYGILNPSVTAKMYMTETMIQALFLLFKLMLDQHMVHELTIKTILTTKTYDVNKAEIYWQYGLTMYKINEVIFTDLQGQYVQGTITNKYRSVEKIDCITANLGLFDF